MRRCPRRGGRYRACQLTSHFLFFIFFCAVFFIPNPKRRKELKLLFVCTGTSKQQLKKNSKRSVDGWRRRFLHLLLLLVERSLALLRKFPKVHLISYAHDFV
jgi:hypothetical protein